MGRGESEMTLTAPGISARAAALLTARPSAERVQAARALLRAHRQNEQLAPQRQILLDFDSTVFPLVTAMAAHPMSPNASYENTPTWLSLADHCGGIPEMLQVFDDVMVFDHMRSHPPFEGVAEAMSRLREDGIRVHVVSDRKPHLQDDVKTYLETFGVHHDSVLCNTPIDKIEWCEANGVSTIVDDNPKTLIGAGEAGISALAIGFHYNRDALHTHSHLHSEDWETLADQLSVTLAANCQRAITDSLAHNVE